MKKKIDNFLEVKGMIDIEAIAASLAASSDNEQSEFFNIFFKALKTDCGDEYRYQMQLTFISVKLSPEACDGCLFMGTKE
jgi:hypothetical protein